MVQIRVTIGGDCFSFVMTPSGVSSYALTGTLRAINRSGGCNPDLNHAGIPEVPGGQECPGRLVLDVVKAGPPDRFLLDPVGPARPELDQRFGRETHGRDAHATF